MKKILLVDDDPITHKLVQSALQPEFQVVGCFTINEAQATLAKSSDFAALILDRGLPDGDGISICFQMRQQEENQNTPILFLSSAGAETDKVGAFFAGADDYITKPFSLLELKARVHARLKKNSKKLTAGMLSLDLGSHRAFIRKGTDVSEVDLTRIEFKILVLLVQSLDQVFQREQLLLKVWGPDCHVSDRVVDSHISHLRKKIAAGGLQLDSIRGEGYRLTASANSKNHVA